MIEAPISEEDLDLSSDYLDEWHGRDAFFDFGEDDLEIGYNGYGEEDEDTDDLIDKGVAEEFKDEIMGIADIQLDNVPIKHGRNKSKRRYSNKNRQN